MKLRKKIAVALLSVVVCLSFAPMAFAQDVTIGGGTGNITITDCTDGKDYSLYKLFDAEQTATGVVFKTAQTSLLAGGVDGGQWFDLKAGGVVTAKAATTSAMLQSADFKTWAKAFGTLSNTTTANADREIAYKQVPFGYYFVETTSGALVMVDAATPDVTMKDKNDNIPVWVDGGKKIIDAKTQQEVTISPATMKAGDTIAYKIPIKTVLVNGLNDKKIFSYYVYDILPEGMTYTNNPATDLVVTVGGAPITNYTVKYYSDETLTTEVPTAAQARAFAINIPWTDDGLVTGNHLYADKAELVVTYSAFLDQTKMDQVKIKGPFKNRAGWDKKEGDDNADPTVPPTITNPETSAEVITGSLEVFKFERNGMQQAALKGAQFELVGDNNEVIFISGTRYVLDPAGTFWQLKPVAPSTEPAYTTTDPNTPGVDQNLYASTTDKYREVTFNEITTGAAGNIKSYVKADGTLVFTGLGEGTYTLKEIVVPDGYNKVNDIQFTLTFDRNTGEWTSSNPAVTYDAGSKMLKTSVENKKGTALPSTGGMGTVLLFACGAALLVGTGIVAYSRKRAKNQLS